MSTWANKYITQGVTMTDEEFTEFIHLLRTRLLEHIDAASASTLIEARATNNNWRQTARLLGHTDGLDEASGIVAEFMASLIRTSESGQERATAKG